MSRSRAAAITSVGRNVSRSKARDGRSQRAVHVLPQPDSRQESKEQSNYKHCETIARRRGDRQVQAALRCLSDTRPQTICSRSERGSRRVSSLSRASERRHTSREPREGRGATPPFFRAHARRPARRAMLWWRRASPLLTPMRAGPRAATRAVVATRVVIFRARARWPPRKWVGGRTYSHNGDISV